MCTVHRHKLNAGKGEGKFNNLFHDCMRVVDPKAWAIVVDVPTVLYHGFGCPTAHQKFSERGAQNLDCIVWGC